MRLRKTVIDAADSVFDSVFSGVKKFERNLDTVENGIVLILKFGYLLRSGLGIREKRKQSDAPADSLC